MILSRSLLLLAVLSSSFISAMAQQQAPPTQVMIVGFVHLSQLNSGASPVDVLQPMHQQSITHLRDALGAFQPDAVMVEEEPKEQADLTAKYRAFCGPTHALPKGEERDEITQIAFPVACKQSHCVR